MIKLWTDEAWADYLYWQGEDRKTLKRINLLIKDIERADEAAAQRGGQVDPLALTTGEGR